MPKSLTASNSEDSILSVGQLTTRIKSVVESEFPRVTVLGEISNCKRAASGHYYLTLKDEFAQIPAKIWRSRASKIQFDLQNGLEVVATGAVEVYAPHGNYSLIIDRIAPEGIGALELAFRQLQQKLDAEGLFDVERKRPLPRYPRRIALITSPTSAAVRDMMQVITRRWRAADLIVLPVAVQGEGAAAQIAGELNVVGEIPGVDVVIVGRGGGSLEDLWAFNEEIVARAIFQCPIPVVSAVGHEIDVSIADFVADRRALTPSEAGELVVPDRAEIHATLARLRQRLVQSLQQLARQGRTHLNALASHRMFTRPKDAVLDRTAALDDLAERLSRSMKLSLGQRQQSLADVAGTLHALSPMRVMQRGYSVTQREDGRVIRTVDDVQHGDLLRTRLADGAMTSRVESAEVNDPKNGV